MQYKEAERVGHTNNRHGWHYFWLPRFLYILLQYLPSYLRRYHSESEPIITWSRQMPMDHMQDSVHFVQFYIVVSPFNAPTGHFQDVHSFLYDIQDKKNSQERAWQKPGPFIQERDILICIGRRKMCPVPISHPSPPETESHSRIWNNRWLACRRKSWLSWFLHGIA